MSTRTRNLAIGLGVVVLAVLAAVAAIAFFNSRDEATVVREDDGPGAARAAGEQPKVQIGNVLILYRHPDSRDVLGPLAEELSGPPDPALEAAGQAVILKREPGLPVAIRVLSASHKEDLRSANDPSVRAFAEFWLGRGAG